MLTAEQKSLIQGVYRKFTSRDGFRPRYGQRVMIAEIAKYLGSIESDREGLRKSDPGVCVVEAGTGTGKTLAYTISVLPMALEEERTVVLSTATTALQEQVMAKDLPELAAHSGMDFKFALAKGRGRYICLSKVDQHLENFAVDQASLPLFLIEQQASTLSQEVLEGFLSAYGSGAWDGDRDTWPEPVEQDIWRSLSTDNQQCANRRCSYFSTCPYYEARNQWEEADVIVANHDLVLSDLALGGGVILPAPESSIYVFDEAHHLADKALSHFTVSGGVRAQQSWLKQLAKTLVDFSPYLGPGNFLAKNIETISTLSLGLQEQLENLFDALSESLPWQTEEGSQERRYRFVQGQIPEDFRVAAKALASDMNRLFGALDDIRAEVTASVDEKSDCGLSKDEAEQWFPIFGSLCSRAESFVQLWHFYAKPYSESELPNARWLVFREFENSADIFLFGSPLSAGEVLRQSLWENAYASILTSATLTALGSFHRLEQKTGLPGGSLYHRVVSPFDFNSVATLRVPTLNAAPNEQAAHTEEIATRLEEFIDGHSAVLVLFSSRKQMNDVFFQVDKSLKSDIVTQDDLSKQELIQQHKKSLDKGKRSIVFGLASLAEGIDLPGKYLTHVIIAKIPFSVPNDPLEESIHEWLEAQGRNAFMEVSVPEASLKLIQACGRLIRSEEDTGLVTILDKRLVTKRYGRALLDALPPYRRELQAQ